MTDHNFKLPSPELEAEIYYLSEQEGGRTQPVVSGYRGQFFYNGRDWDAPQEFINKGLCNTGEYVTVKLQTASPNFHMGQFYVGQVFETREGSKIVGRGKITKILRPDFLYWDFDTFFKTLPADCIAYDDQTIESFITTTYEVLSLLKELEDLTLIKSLSNLSQMLTIECNLHHKSIQPRELTEDICRLWKEKIQLKNAHYKIDVATLKHGFRFELTFATWHSLFLTGKLIINIFTH